MNPTPGYYCVIQFCPDQSRLEAANVGVIVFCPEQNYLDAKLSTDNARVQKFFGRDGFDWERINSYKLGLRERLGVEKEGFKSLSDLETFAARRGNSLRITPPRPMTVRDPAQDLETLFEQLVGSRKKSRSGAGFRRILRQKFTQANLGRKLQSDLEVTISRLDKQLDVPFGYQNGRFNLIQPVNFRSENPDQLTKTASVHAVDGMAVYGEPNPRFGDMRLIVVANFSAEARKAASQVEKILDQGHVKLYTSKTLDRLIQDIQTNGKELA